MAELRSSPPQPADGEPPESAAPMDEDNRAPPPRRGRTPEPAPSPDRERVRERSRSRSPPPRRGPSPPPRSGPPAATCRIYVGNIPFSYDRRDLEDMFSRCGRVIDTKVVTNRDTGRSKGYGFVTFDSEDSRRRAIEDYDGTTHEGREISVTNAHDKGPGSGPSQYRDGPSGGRARTPPELKFRITLGGLPSQMDWKDVKDFLRDAGEVHYVNRKQDGDWLADFNSESEMRSAVSYLDGREYRGAYLHARVEYQGSSRGPPPSGGRSRSPYDRPPPRYRDDYDRRPREPHPRDRYDPQDDRGYDRRPPPPRDAYEPAPVPPRRDDSRYRDDYDRRPPPRDYDDRGDRYGPPRSGGSRGGRYHDDPPPPADYRDDYRGRGRDEPRGRPRDDGGRYDSRGYPDDGPPPARGPPPPRGGGSYPPERSRYSDPEPAPPPRSRYADDYARDRYQDRSPAKRGPPPDDYPRGSSRDRDYRPPRREDDYARPPARGPPPPAGRADYRDYAY